MPNIGGGSYTPACRGLTVARNRNSPKSGKFSLERSVKNIVSNLEQSPAKNGLRVIACRSLVSPNLCSADRLVFPVTKSSSCRVCARSSDEDTDLDASQTQPIRTTAPPAESSPAVSCPGADAFTTRGKLLQRRVEVELGDGYYLRVEALSEQWLEDARDVLSEAFASSMGGLSQFQTFLQRQIGSYLVQHMNLPPLAVVLVAVIVPCGADDCTEDFSGALDGGEAGHPPSLYSPEIPSAQEQIVGTVELSFSHKTRTQYLTLNPPKDCAYLCNMAVAEPMRGRGFGAHLLAAAEEFARVAGRSEVFLHVRLQDKIPRRLYTTRGYETVSKDVLPLQLLGLDRRYLMRKSLQ